MENAISYLDVMKNAELVFVIDKNIENNKDSIYIIKYEEIPEKYLPSPSSFCPEFERKSSLVFPVRLKGGLADFNKASPKTISDIETGLYKLFDKATSLIRGIYESEVLLQPSSAGSFEINFIIENRTKQMDLLLNDNDYNNYVNNYIQYCMEYLNEEIGMICELESGEAAKYEKLLKEYTEIINAKTEKQYAKAEEKLAGALVFSYKTIGDLSKTVGKNHAIMTIENATEGRKRNIGYIDEQYREKIGKKNNEIKKKFDEYIIGKKPIKYRAKIVSLNVQSRKGIAAMYRGEKIKDRNRRINIMGEKKLRGTKFINSLNNNEYIEIKGYPRRDKDRFFRIEIEY